MNIDGRSKIDSVDIALDEAGDCCLCDRPGFNRDYPFALKNYIDRNDFQQSIRNINNTFPKTFYSSISFIAILFLVALALTAVGILIMIQGFQGRQKDEFGFIIMACIFIMVAFIICILSCRCYINKIKSVEPIRRAIEQESKKYEERHCRWRLIKKKDEPTVLESRRHQVEKFHIIIDIDQTIRSESKFDDFSRLDASSQEQQRLTT